MTASLPVFVNDRPVAAPAGATAAEAVALADPALAGALRDGRAFLTDGRGIRLDPAAGLHAGAILRVVVSARARAPGA
jgi:hypothetical protein